MLVALAALPCDKDSASCAPVLTDCPPKATDCTDRMRWGCRRLEKFNCSIWEIKLCLIFTLNGDLQLQRNEWKWVHSSISQCQSGWGTVWGKYWGWNPRRIQHMKLLWRTGLCWWVEYRCTSENRLLLRTLRHSCVVYVLAQKWYHAVLSWVHALLPAYSGLRTKGMACHAASKRYKSLIEGSLSTRTWLQRALC